MKQLKLLLLLVFLIGIKNLEAAETEPNNTKAQANTLALNGNNSGAITTATDEDWWKITTNADGKLSVTITVSNSKTLRCYIYDNNGTTLLNSGYSSNTTTVTQDGLAAGVYYVKLIAYYAGEQPAYTVSNTLTVPAQANDNEPNNSRAQALNLQQNKTTAGHVGYYYNVQRDTADWYKITTNANGLLRVKLTSANGNTLRVYLYDNNGTTLLNSHYSSSVATINQDGLAPGTYYVKVFCYYNTEFAPYSLTDSLYLPAQANDAEPNNSRAQAVTLLQNKTTTGHVGYYYNVQRDTADWFKIATNDDGLLRLKLTSANGNTLRVYLYDNDGATLLNSDYSSSLATINEDGLAPGTYYVKVFCYYNTQFAPYTLTDSLITYNYTADAGAEPNKYASQAATIPANENITGHTGFYYNHTRDSADWWKINYTGSGNLSFTINQETLLTGGTNTLRFQVYKDTAAAAIHSSYSSAASRIVNLSALTKGYYWIKIYPYYNTEFSSYSLSNTFTQVNIAAIRATSYDTAGSCGSNNSISFKPTKSKSPYTIQLYRFGIAYGSAVTTNKLYTFTNLPSGSYYATAYGDGATGTAFGKSKTIAVEPIPAGLSTTNITSTKAKLNWSGVACADNYSISYRADNATGWTNKKTKNNGTFLVIKNLAPNTKYYWKVATSETENDIAATGAYSDSISFTTASSLIADTDEENDLSVKNLQAGNTIKVSPNPASSYFVINYNQTVKIEQRLRAQLFDMKGQAVWSSGLINATSLNGRQVNVSGLTKGVFYLKIFNENGVVTATAKVIVSK